MKSNDSLQVFINLILEKHTALKNALDKFFEVIVSENKEEKLLAVKTLYEQGLLLSKNLAVQDKPYWLSEILDKTQWYIANAEVRNNVNSLILSWMMSIRTQASSHRWSFGESYEGSVIDFDNLYEKHKNQGKLKDLFDNLIDILEKIIVSHQIDSLRALERLNKLLALLRKNREGSVLSMFLTWQFARDFLKNSAWSLLDEVPVLKNFKAGFEKTLEQMGYSFDEIEVSVKKELSNQFNNINELLLPYTRSSIKQLPAPTEKE